MKKIFSSTKMTISNRYSWTINESFQLTQFHIKHYDSLSLSVSLTPTAWTVCCVCSNAHRRKTLLGIERILIIFWTPGSFFHSMTTPFCWITIFINIFAQCDHMNAKDPYLYMKNDYGNGMNPKSTYEFSDIGLSVSVDVHIWNWQKATKRQTQIHTLQHTNTPPKNKLVTLNYFELSGINFNLLLERDFCRLHRVAIWIWHKMLCVCVSIHSLCTHMGSDGEGGYASRRVEDNAFKF